MARQKKPCHDHQLPPGAQRGSLVRALSFGRGEAHPRTTSIPATNDETDAVNWAYANLNTDRPKTISLGQHAADFFDPKRCKWTRRMVSGRRQRDFNSQYLSSRRGYLVNYILPRWRAVPLHMITADGIDAWLEDLDSTRGTPLSGSTLDKVLHTLRIILKEAKREGLIHENPAYDLDPFDTAGGSRKREPFARAEIRKLFPAKLDDCIQIWGTLEWYTYFLIACYVSLRYELAEHAGRDCFGSCALCCPSVLPRSGQAFSPGRNCTWWLLRRSRRRRADQSPPGTESCGDRTGIDDNTVKSLRNNPLICI